MSDSFDDLLARIEAVGEEQATMAKSMGAGEPDNDDNTDANVADASENPEDKDDKDDDGDESKTDESMTKALADQGYEVVDAEELLKSISSLDERLGGHEMVLAKALKSVLGTVENQASMIKSLNDKVEKLSGSGAPRKSVLAITERRSVNDDKTDHSKQELGPSDIIAKSMSALQSGKLSGYDASRIENYVQSGQKLPADLLAQIS